MQEEKTKVVIDFNKKSSPIKRMVEIPFESIVKEGSHYVFRSEGHDIKIGRSIFSEKQRSLFDSLSEY